MATTIRISGMSCEHCVKRVTKALEGRVGATDVRINLETGTATFDNPRGVGLDEIAKAVEEAGYKVERRV